MTNCSKIFAIFNFMKNFLKINIKFVEDFHFCMGFIVDRKKYSEIKYISNL